MHKAKKYVVAIAKKTKDNLCDTCKLSNDSCKSKVITFGNNPNTDNVIACETYRPKYDYKNVVIGRIVICGNRCKTSNRFNA